MTFVLEMPGRHNLRETIEQEQVDWAKQKGIVLGPPPDSPTSRVCGYVKRLEDNLFEPLANSIQQQFIAGKGGELNPPDAKSGKMYAVYSSSALCVNLFQRATASLGSETFHPSLESVLTALGLPRANAFKIEFEARNEVNPNFTTAPHLDVQISFADGKWRRAGIEAKFCEPYGSERPSGLMTVYLKQKRLWLDWPNLFAFAQRLSPDDSTHLHLHAAQLIKHLLGLRNQCGLDFVLVYLWFDVPGESAALCHRHEIQHFGEVLKRNGIPFHAPTYQEVFARLRASEGDSPSPYLRYMIERYFTNLAAD